MTRLASEGRSEADLVARPGRTRWLNERRASLVVFAILCGRAWPVLAGMVDDPIYFEGQLRIGTAATLVNALLLAAFWRGWEPRRPARPPSR